MVSRAGALPKNAYRLERVLLNVDRVGDEDANELTARFVDEPAHERRMVGVGAASLFALMSLVAAVAIADGQRDETVEPIRIAVEPLVVEEAAVTDLPDPEKYEPRLHAPHSKPKIRGARHARAR
jgi:hypothetical protein